jgi:hypothetical protein
MPSPYHMVVARDGAVGLPVLPPTRDISVAAEQFNRCFAALLVGGVYCEAVNARGLGRCTIKPPGRHRADHVASGRATV